MTRKTRPVSWIGAALKEFETFPEGASRSALLALTITAEGGKADIAKPMHGMDSGIFEIALSLSERCVPRGLRVQFAGEVWVVHAFQKRSRRKAPKTPKREIDVIKHRLKRLKDLLQ